MIWPRKRLPDALMRGAPPGSLGAVSDSGWTDGKLFVKWLLHFIERTKTSKDDPAILIVDGHNSHKSLEAIDLARENGISIITLPPHSTHKMQPLDRTFFKSLKANYNRAADNYMTTNVGKRITFYEMADLFGKAYGMSATVEKAVKGFQTTGIWPFDDSKFSDEDFAASNMTDELLPTDMVCEQPSTKVASPRIIAVVGQEEPSGISAVIGQEELSRIIAALPIPVAGSSHPGLDEARRILAELSPSLKIAKPRSRTRKSEKAEIITSSPYKETLQRKQSTLLAGGNSDPKRKLKTNRGRNSVAKKAKVDTTPCCICRKRYCDPPFESWQECPTCRKWYHESCGPDDTAVCYKCLG